jgi:hypothetical protein
MGGFPPRDLRDVPKRLSRGKSMAGFRKVKDE